VKAYLVDPYQRDVHTLTIEHNIRDWARLLDCQYLDVARVATLPNGRGVDVWVDDEGLLLEPIPPTFRLCGRVLAGYGLALEGNPEDGETHEASFPIEWFKGRLSFEQWEKRLDVRNYFEQLTRYLISK
jgi:hypothetical protein